MSYPKSRNKNVIVQEVSNDTLVYDLVTNKAVCLNETSASIWKLCNGTNTVREISEKMTSKLKESISEEYIWLALNQLKKEELIEENEGIEDKYQGLSRREIIRKIGYGSMIALPIVSSVVAPTAASAQSGGLPLRAPCATNSQCASGACRNTPFFLNPSLRSCCAAGAGASIDISPCVFNQAQANASCCTGVANPIQVNPACPPSSPFVSANSFTGTCT